MACYYYDLETLGIVRHYEQFRIKSEIAETSNISRPTCFSSVWFASVAGADVSHYEPRNERTQFSENACGLLASGPQLHTFRTMLRDTALALCGNNLGNDGDGVRSYCGRKPPLSL